MQGKYLDELNVGEDYITPSRTLTETDVVMFAAMSGDYNELHTSEAYMKGSQFGKRLVHGLLGLSISHGLIFRLGILDGTAIALLGVDTWQGYDSLVGFDKRYRLQEKLVICTDISPPASVSEVRSLLTSDIFRLAIEGKRGLLVSTEVPDVDSGNRLYEMWRDFF